MTCTTKRDYSSTLYACAHTNILTTVPYSHAWLFYNFEKSRWPIVTYNVEIRLVYRLDFDTKAVRKLRHLLLFPRKNR